MVGALYTENDVRRDAGFSIFYMGINIGAMIAPLICGYLGENINWHYGFGAAGVGMTLGLIQYVLGGKYLGRAGLDRTGATADFQLLRKVLIGALIVSVVAAALIFAGIRGVIQRRSVLHAPQGGLRGRGLSTGPDALKSFDRSGANLVLLDLMLPGLPGSEVCRTLREKSNVPVIMLTAKDSEIDKVVGLELGAATTSPSRSPPASLSPGCAPCCGAGARRTSRPRRSWNQGRSGWMWTGMW